MDNNRIVKKLLIYITIFVIGGCQSYPPTEPHAAYEVAKQWIDHDIKNNKKIDAKKAKNIPDDVNRALIDITRFGQKKQRIKRKSRKFDIIVNDADAKEFFMGLVNDTDYSMIVNPDISGNISLSLKNVTIEEVLDTVERVYGFQYYISENGYEILPDKLDTRIFSLNYLDMERIGTSAVEMTTAGVSGFGGGRGGFGRGGFGANGFNNGFNNGGVNNFNNGFGGNPGIGSGFSNSSSSQLETKTVINFWGKLEDTLLAMIGDLEGRKVVVNPQSGVIVIKAYPKELRVAAEYLDRVQRNMSRQVIIEAKIIEVDLTDNYQLGIDWKLFERDINTVQGIGGTDSSAYVGLIKWVSDDFETNIRALANQGTVQVLSSPRVSTLNNQKAVIKVGNDEFFVTDIATGLANNINNTSTAISNVDLNPFFSGITLDVTPYVDDDEIVTLHVHPAVSNVTEQTKAIQLNANDNLEVPLANSTVRETDSVVRATNGQVIVLGGLMSDRTEENIAKLPYIGDLPFIGKVFRTTEQQSTKTELVILLKASVVEPRTWSSRLKHAKRRLNRLDKGFHLGNRPDLYGTEAEDFVKNWPIHEKVIDYFEQDD